MGLVDFNVGFNGDLRAQLMHRAQAQLAQQQMAEQQRRARFSEGMQEKTFNSNEELKRAQLDATAEARRDATTQREREYGLKLNDTIQPGLIPETPETARTIATLRAVGAGSDQAERPRVDEGPLMPGDTGAAKPKGFLKVASANQANVLADNERAAAQARAMESDRAEGRRLQEEATRQRASDAAAMRGVVASNHGVADEFKRLQIEEKRDKMDAAKKATADTADSARQQTELALDLVGQLEKHPGLDKTSGMFDSRVADFDQDAIDANALRDQVIAALTRPNVGALKGSMSEKELAFVKDLSSRLQNRRQSDAATRKALAEAKTFLQSKSHESAPVAGSGAAADPLGLRK